MTSHDQPVAPAEAEDEDRASVHDPGSLLPPLAALALGVGMIVVAARIPAGGLSSDPGPAFLPRLAGVGLVCFALFLLWRREAHERLPRGENLVRVVGTVALTLAYVLTMRPLGFLMATALFLAAEMMLIGLRRPVVVLPMALLMSAGVYALFRYGLEVPLPATRIGSVTL